MSTPNWQHNSGKDPKRSLKPQALRQAKARRQAFLRQLMNRPPNAPNHPNP
jgi:hypothetical protein